MFQILFMTPKALLSMLFYQSNLQQQVIDLQQQVIELQKRIDNMSPKTPPDKEVFWHVASGGLLSDEAANSDDLATVRKFQKWNIAFAKKYIKPYVDHKVYGECLNQMTRGLTQRIAELESNEVERTTKITTNTPILIDDHHSKAKQLVLIQ